MRICSRPQVSFRFRTRPSAQRKLEIGGPDLSKSPNVRQWDEVPLAVGVAVHATDDQFRATEDVLGNIQGPLEIEGLGLEALVDRHLCGAMGLDVTAKLLVPSTSPIHIR